MSQTPNLTPPHTNMPSPPPTSGTKKPNHSRNRRLGFNPTTVWGHNSVLNSSRIPLSSKKDPDCMPGSPHERAVESASGRGNNAKSQTEKNGAREEGVKGTRFPTVDSSPVWMYERRRERGEEEGTEQTKPTS